MSASRASPTGDEESSPAATEELSAEDRRVLAYASAIGREFDFRLLVTAIEADDERLAEQLERLTHEGVLREREGGDRFAFAHDTFRTRLYQSLTASRLRVLHRRIAEAMERLYPQPPDEIVPELGRHYFLGRVPEKAYRYNRAAALLALQSDTPDSAIHHLEQARLDIVQLRDRSPEEAAELDLFLGGMYQGIGEFDHASQCYATGLGRAGSSHPRLRGQLLLGQAELRQEQRLPRDAEDDLQEAQLLLERGGDAPGIARVHRWRAVEQLRAGHLQPALDETMAAADLVRDGTDPRLQGQLDVDLANLFGRLGPDTESEMTPWFERGIARLAAVGDFEGVARGYALLGGLLTDTRPADALDYLVRAREYLERTRDQREVARVLARTVPVRVAVGDFERAERDFQQASRLLQRTDDAIGRLLLHLGEGALAEQKGRPSEAERAYREAAHAAEELQLTGEAADAHLALARLLARRGATQDAERELAEAGRLGTPQVRPGWRPRFLELSREISTGTRAS